MCRAGSDWIPSAGDDMRMDDWIPSAGGDIGMSDWFPSAGGDMGMSDWSIRERHYSCDAVGGNTNSMSLKE